MSSSMESLERTAAGDAVGVAARVGDGDEVDARQRPEDAARGGAPSCRGR